MDVAKLAQDDVAGSSEGGIAQPTEREFAEDEVPDLVEGKESHACPSGTTGSTAGGSTEDQENSGLDEFLQSLDISVKMGDLIRPHCYYCKRATGHRCGGCHMYLFCSKACIQKVFFPSGQYKSDRKGWRTHRLACDPPDVRFGDVDKPLALWITLWKPMA